MVDLAQQGEACGVHVVRPEDVERVWPCELRRPVDRVRAGVRRR